MVAFCSTVQKSHWLFCVGSLNLTVSRFQNRICTANQENEKNIYYVANDAATVDSRQLKIWRETRRLLG